MISKEYTKVITRMELELITGNSEWYLLLDLGSTFSILILSLQAHQVQLREMVREKDQRNTKILKRNS